MLSPTQGQRCAAVGVGSLLAAPASPSPVICSQCRDECMGKARESWA